MSAAALIKEWRPKVAAAAVADVMGQGAEEAVAAAAAGGGGKGDAAAADEEEDDEELEGGVRSLLEQGREWEELH